ncbi:uncharacterized protein LOC114976055 [Acropora millepora]|uniref:uncharacterized protein LOC114976055 n=1 Tax=Acropora millepora TaxID=45264 RepID=UPI001CF4670C|nr:uncharacterized protein LOC114976055 [Acropora millepora]
MNIVAFAIVSFAFLCLEPSARGEADRYRMAIEEKGTPFAEEIDIDEDQDVEVFRVPAHNDVDGADFYHDFKMRLTVTRIPSRKVCYISKMDPSLPAPGKLKADFDRTAVQRSPLPTVGISHSVTVTEPANRLVLTKAILDFCGALPIYKTKTIEGVGDNGTSTLKVERLKRQTSMFIPCDKVAFASVISTCTGRLDLLCKMRSHSCFYFVTCIDLRPRFTRWNCTDVHLTSRFAICCDVSCV